MNVIICGLILTSLVLFVTWHTSRQPDSHLSKAGIISAKSDLPIVIWSSDFHISPVADIKHLLKDFTVRVIDKSLSSHCYLQNTCATDLKVLTQNNGISLAPCPNDLRRQFYEAYRQDPEFMAADAILCTHAISMCEIFMPFKKPLILIASTRYEIGRHDKTSWERWNSNLELISSKTHNTIAANNVYDMEYMKYFTPLQNITLLPSHCAYVNAKYSPDPQKGFLLAPSRGVNPHLERALKRAAQELSSVSQDISHAKQDPILIRGIREVYPLHHEYADLAKHMGIVVLPYQVSFMSLFEFYRMQIPLFVPSVSFLTRMHLQYHILNERTWDSVYGHPGQSSLLPRHPLSTSSVSRDKDPNDEFGESALTAWLSLSDLYQWPHILQFESFEHLVHLLRSTNLTRVSERMGEYNDVALRNVRISWHEILDKIRRHKREQQGRRWTLT
ncbi:hypothetical protein EON64_11640 [archaeon]|nr:MAG: hypothetical protein EON64_11640 [archaeon]